MTKSTRSTTELLQIGLEATTFVLIRQMLSVAFEAVDVFLACPRLVFSLRRHLDAQSRPPHRHGKPGDFGSLFFCAFSAFSKIFGATFEKKYKFCDAAEPSGA